MSSPAIWETTVTVASDVTVPSASIVTLRSPDTAVAVVMGTAGEAAACGAGRRCDINQYVAPPASKITKIRIVDARRFLRGAVPFVTGASVSSPSRGDSAWSDKGRS